MAQYAAVLKRSTELTIIAACDTSPVARERARSILGDIPVYDDAIEMMSSEPLELVVILTPPSTHEALVLKVLGHGLHVYCEKPLSTTLPNATDLVALAGSLGLGIGWAPDTPFSEPMRTARRLLEAGTIGQLAHLEVRCVNGGPELWHPSPAQFYSPDVGPLCDLGPYCFALLSFFGGKPNRVTAFASTDAPGRVRVNPHTESVIDVGCLTHISGVVEFRSGVTGAFVCSFASPAVNRNEVVLYGSSGVLRLPAPTDHDGDILRWHDETNDWEILHRSMASPASGRGLGVVDLCRRIDASVSFPDWSITALDLLAATEMSIQRGTVVKLVHR